jgi:hypothetical protein
MIYHFRTIRLSQLARLRRLAAEGVCVRHAAATVGLPKRYVWDWARSNRVHFSTPAGRGTPDWLVPELARQAEDALRATWAAAMRLGRIA